MKTKLIQHVIYHKLLGCQKEWAVRVGVISSGNLTWGKKIEEFDSLEAARQFIPPNKCRFPKLSNRLSNIYETWL